MISLSCQKFRARNMCMVFTFIHVLVLLVLFNHQEIEQLQNTGITQELDKKFLVYSISSSNQTPTLTNSSSSLQDLEQICNQKFDGITSKQDAKPKLVLGILSANKHVTRRLAQRNTWISAMAQMKDILPFDVIYKFILDHPTELSTDENTFYNDIMYINVSNHGYANRFGEKLYLWLKYLYQYYPDAALGARVDDDVYLCVPQMLFRLYELKSTTLYYGWTHKNPRMQIDEMFIVLGEDLIRRIANRQFCGKRICSRKNQLSERNYGHEALVEWLSIYSDIDRHTDNNRMAVYYRGKEYKMEHLITKDSCVNYILFHKTTAEQMNELYRFNMIQNMNYNVFSNISITEIKRSYSAALPFSPGATSGSEFSGDVVRPLIQVILNKNYSPSPENSKQKTCLRWAVVTTAFMPSKAVKFIAGLHNWCLVIVADENTPPKTTYLKNMEIKQSENKIKFLTVDDQKRLYPLLFYNIPLKSYGRKNFGYVFAIDNGAKYIWDFDDDNYGIIDFTNVGKDTINLSYSQVCNDIKHYLINPYPYFGVKEYRVWPRGFPLQSIKYNKTTPRLCEAKDVEVGIIQSLANGQPDVDAIFRLTREVPFNFSATEKSHPALIISRNIFAPFNAQATQWSSSTFDFLALPISVNGRVSDIWRGYIAQHFMHKNNIHLAFVPPYVYQTRNPHTIIRDFNAEQDLYEKSDKLVSFLSSPEANTYKNIVEMYEALYVRKYIEYSDLTFIKAWQTTIRHVKQFTQK